MRKIDKTKILSTQYKSWEESLEEQGLDHPKYNSSKNENYVDVVMNLLYVQDGLCAYTEMRLCKDELISDNNWENERYGNRNPQIFGQLDHFDPELKVHKGWLWSNFFLIHSDINTRVKRKKEVDYILKPDIDEYAEEILLEYICSDNIFIANTSLPINIQKRINDMIYTLGINYDPVIDHRRRYISDKIKQIEFKIKDWDSIEIDEFPTAFKMCKIQNQ